MGLAVAGAVFVNVALSNLQILLPDVPRSTLQLAITGTSGAYFKSLSEDLQEQSTRVIVSAIGKTFIFVYVGAAVSLVLSILFTVSIFRYRSRIIWSIPRWIGPGSLLTHASLLATKAL